MKKTIDEAKKELSVELRKTVDEMTELFSTIDEDKVNTIPYEGSWTAGELLRHVAKATRGLHEMLGAPTRSLERDPGQRIEEFAAIFLNFSTKMKSPDFIIPEKKLYERQYSIDQFKKNFIGLEDAIQQADMSQVVEGLPFGEITKLEMLYFLLYHTQRHLHQLHKIHDALEEKAA